MKLRLILLLSWLCIVAFAQDVGNQQAVLSNARQAYYSLQDQGLASFRCDLTPNWDAVLADEWKSNPAGADTALKTLNQLRFTVSVLANKTTITHNELSGENAKMQEALSQIYSGMQQMTEGFFDTWRLFAWDSPFPAVNSDYRLEDAGASYRLIYKEGAANVVTVMGKDFVIRDLAVSTPQFDSALRLAFARTHKGAFLLNKYGAVYQTDKPEETSKLAVAMDYQVVEGFYLPQNLSLSGSYGTSPFAIQLVFSGCQVGKK